MSNTVQNGKGDKPRVSCWRKYRESELWENLKKKKESKDESSKENTEGADKASSLLDGNS